MIGLLKNTHGPIRTNEGDTNMTRRIIQIAFMALFTLLLVGALSANARATEIVSFGTSDNLTWALDDEGLLKISGTGEISQLGEF